jgi:hypothetical protein
MTRPVAGLSENRPRVATLLIDLTRHQLLMRRASVRDAVLVERSLPTVVSKVR